MRFSSLVAVAAAGLAVLSSVASAASNVMIYTDYSSGLSTVFGQQNTNSFGDAQFNTQTRTYLLPNTGGAGFGGSPRALTNGTITIGLAWANDADDTVLFGYTTQAAGGTQTALPLVFTAFGPYASSCAVPNTGASIQLTAAVPYCNLTISWTRPFVGNLLIGYSNQSATSGQTEAITLFFVNAAAVVGDPQFVGLRGQSYQVHGIDGAVYNLITESNTQVNSRFVFLTEGECPTVNGKVDTVGCWSHPGSYMGEMSFQSVVDGKLHAALITSGDAKKGFSAVQMDGKALKVGETVAFGAFSITLTTSHSAMVTLDNYNIELTNSDMFVNLALTAKVSLSQLKSHGLIGQTHSTKTYKNLVKYVEGDIDDYMVAEDDVFGTSFPFNKFGQE